MVITVCECVTIIIMNKYDMNGMGQCPLTHENLKKEWEKVNKRTKF